MCTMPSTPKSRAVQPTTWRPAGPLRSGSRRLRQATKQRSSGTNQATRPTEPATTARTTSPTPPGSCHQTAAATTTARPTRNSPAPSRRCSGSRSPAVWPMRRTPPPTAWATPSQAATTHPREGAEDPEDRTRARCAPPAGRDAALRGRPLLRGRLALRGGSRRPGARGRAPLPAVNGCGRRCSCCATPAGKTYGSPCSANLPRTPHLPLASHAEHSVSSAAGFPRRAESAGTRDSRGEPGPCLGIRQRLRATRAVSSSGSRSRKVLPLPSSELTRISPPCICAIRREMARPRPVPGMESASGLLERWKAENRCTWSAVEMPRPVSAHSTTAWSPSMQTSRWTAPPGRVYFTALLARLSITLPSSSGSAVTITGVVGDVQGHLDRALRGLHRQQLHASPRRACAGRPAAARSRACPAPGSRRAGSAPAG